MRVLHGVTELHSIPKIYHTHLHDNPSAFCMVKHTPPQTAGAPGGKNHSSAPAAVSGLAQAFFSGKIRDRTTKESRKAAEDLSILKNKQKNPGWMPLNSKVRLPVPFGMFQTSFRLIMHIMQGAKVNLKTIDVNKARGKIAGTMPSDVASSLVEQAGGGACPSSSSSGFHAAQMQSVGPAALASPLREEVRRDILRRMEALFKSGKTFEDGAAYVDNERDAEDARLIVQGVDPASVEAARRGDLFFESREIPIERRHWMATMQGLFSTAKFGCAYVHTDGSLTMLQQGKDVVCRCGEWKKQVVVHTGI